MIVDSTAWLRLKFNALDTPQNRIKIGKQERNHVYRTEEDFYFDREVELTLDNNNMVYVRDQINHFLGECSNYCLVCKELESNK